MIVICEECGKKYRIDASKIKGTAASFKCRVCTHMIMVSKPQAASSADSQVDLSATDTAIAAADTEAPAETEEPAMSTGGVDDLQDVKAATIQIESQGTFVDPEFGLVQNGAGRGSGFIIDPSGLAVTNNHVVTGAALLKVWVGGEDAPRNAKVLGVSECSDLAVIDIEGDRRSSAEGGEEVEEPLCISGNAGGRYELGFAG